MSIKILDKNVISKIAAGEVIENPASVIKELVENSIDAGAKHIDIYIEDDGTKLIKVTDDGSGFDIDDIEIAFKQHATSKIREIEDLDSISSYGFRGEALSSIAVISNVTLVTKRNDDSTYGYKYTNDFGTGNEIVETASNVGTTIEVRNLFENVPVRKKFLKGNKKESALVEDIVIKFALSRPDISFLLNIDNRIKLKTYGDSKLINVIYLVYGKDIANNLIEVNEEVSGVKVSGYISKTSLVRNTRSDLIYFVNGRYIKDRVINRAIDAAYDGYLMQHRFPLTVLKIDAPNSIVDVNVHPKKLEVRFSDDEKIYHAVYTALHNRIINSNLIFEESIDDATDLDYTTEDLNVSEENVEFNNDNINIDIDTLPSLSSVLYIKEPESINLSNLYLSLSKKYVEKPIIKSNLFENYRYIGQIFKTYILIEYDNKLYIIDQHAAHEKINYENLMKSYKNGEEISQKIFPSIMIKLKPLQFEALEKNIAEFKKIGYEIELFGDNDIKVDAVPYNIFNIGNKDLLMDMIDSFADDNNKEEYDSLAEKIASISCKKAIKANYVLSEDEVRQLLSDLSKLDNPYNCPHGRPVIISLSKQEFEKKFGRIV